MQRLLKIFIVIFTASNLTGCIAGFSGNRVPATPMDYSALQTPKRNVYLEIVNLRSMDGSTPKENNWMPEENRKIVEHSLRKSNLFKSIKLSGLDQEADDLKMQITITENQFTSGFAGGLTIFSLGLIPSSARTDFVVELKVKKTTGELLQISKNEDYVTQWVGWFVIPWSSHTMLDAKTDTLDRQLSDAINRLVASKELAL